jgi:hypothetical protein
MIRAFVLIAAAGSFTACDAPTQIAGGAVQGEMRNAITSQCQQAAEGAGIVAGQVTEICECSAETFLADPDLSLGDVSRERIEGIVNECAAKLGSGATQSLPAEEIGG